MRYRGSLLGFMWSFLNPLCLMLVYMLVFRYYIRFNQVENYTIFLFCGLLPWIWFSSALSEGTSSIVSGGHLITRSMFPAQVLPVVATLTATIHFLLSLPLLFVFMFFAGLPFKLTLLFLPILVLLQFGLGLGLSLALGSLNVHFRDTQHIVANLLSLLFFLCPIVYPSSVVPSKFWFSMELNPVALITRLYHQLILDGVLPSIEQVVYLSSVVMICLIVGNMIYNFYRESFAELL